MADWNKPTNSSLYQTEVLPNLKDRDIDTGSLFLNTPTNPVTGMIRYNRSTNNFQEWDGTTWVNRILSVAGGGTGSGTQAGAIAGLGLGTMASQNSNAVAITGGSMIGVAVSATSLTEVVALNHGGTGAALSLGPYATFLMSNATGVVFGTDGRNLDSLNASNLAFGTVPAARLPGRQVVQAYTLTATLANTSGVYIDAVNANVTITPTATTSKILVQFSVNTQLAATSGSTNGALRIMRSIAGGAATQVVENLQVAQAGVTGAAPVANQILIQFLDSPNTISACTYQLKH